MGVLDLSQSTLGGGFEPEPEYSGRGFHKSNRNTVPKDKDKMV